MKKPLINHTTSKPASRWLMSGLGALILGLGFTGAASAAEFYLQTQSYTKTITLPDASTVNVPMWGFASCTDDTFATCDVLSDDALTTVQESLAAGPQLNVDLANNPLSSTNNALTIHVNNTLNVPVSLVIPGQAGGGDPVTYPDGKGRTRMRSMTKETPAGATVTYDWASLKTGTYMYQSGTQPSIQVPMGLFGSLVVNADATTDAANPVAYPGISYNSDAVLLFSEVDPVQNQRVISAIQAALVAGSDPVATEACLPMADFNKSGGTDFSKYPCTIDYNPIYFLVNGQPTADNLPQIGDGTATQNVLLRFLNAGLRTHTPAFVGVELGLIAEDGNPYPGEMKQQATALLPAGKTLDALVVTPATDVSLSLFDHMPTFKNEASTNGGALATLQVGSGTPETVPTTNAANDTYAVIEDTELNTALEPVTSVLTNDCDTGNTPPCSDFNGATMVSAPVNGILTLNADGSFTYTPNKDFSGVDGFTYSAINISSGETYSASVTLNVSFMNDAPVAAVDGPYSNTVGTEITVDEAHGLLANDMDVDGDELTVVIEGTAPAGLTLNQRVDVNGIAIPNSYDGSFTYAGTTATTFTYHANDGTADSNSVVVSLEPKPVSNIALIVQEPVVTGEAPVLVTSYRWIVQEDTTFHLDPLNPQITPVRQQQSLNFHKSSMPVIAQGCTDCYDSSNLLPGVDPTAPNFDPTDPANYENNSIPFNQVALDPNKYYYVSVLPNDAGTGQGHTIGGAQILPGQTDVTVIVNKQEIPTAQVSVFVFEDNAPTNGAVDGNEQGLGGFPITLEDAGGRYGISGGTMSQDAYGNPLKNALDCFQGYQMPPAGVILSCPNTPENQAAGLVGQVLIKDLPPGKYGVIALPPASEKNWTQTSTIEGTKVIDTWVKAAEPPYFVEFGLTGPHAFIGFVNPEHSCMGADPCQVPAPASTTPLHNITGNVTLLHDPRPPGLPLTVDTGSYDGLSYTRAWIGLNSDAGIGPSIATVQASNDPAHLGEFTIAGIPDGTYQLVVWDTYLDQIISFQTVTVAGGDVSLGNVGVPAWFTRTEHNVFLDDGCAGTTGGGIAGDGIRQDCEVGMPEQAINLRWRDGTVNQSYPTDSTGFVPFDQAFPFFSWQIYEVDYTRFKPTGVTVTVDAGGPVNETNILNPQVQNPAYFTAGNEACTDATCETRTETGSSVLLEAYQGFPGQTSTFDWGKVPYAPGENGGISGIVFYSSTRGEGDPRLTVGDPWEPGIASVKMRLYSVIQRDPNLVDTNVEPLDDFPNVAGGDIDVNGNGLYDGPEVLTLVQEVETDSWDKSQPTGCQGEDPADPFTVNTLEGDVTHCYDGFRNWNQVRPGVFDGGYAFNNISPGKYVVEAVLPPGYEQYKEQDMNVGFGDAYGSNLGPAPVSVVLPNGSLVLVVPDQAMILAAQGPQYGLAQPPCVGKYHQVPDELSLFPGEPAPFAQAWRPLCDRKEVVLSDQGQAAADFHFFTSTPVAAQFTGLITDDISNETNPNSPGFGEKWSPAYMPFTIRDFNDNIVYSGLGDAFGRYNGLLPSTFSANIPIPSGYSPAMMSACLNESGATKNNRYLSACYTGQFMPGTNTYLDTPILPTSAFAGGFNSPDCAAAEGAPVIAEVNAIDASTGTVTGFGPLVSSGGTLQIVSQGTAVVVPNPAYEGPLALAPYNAPTITRDHSFGTTQGAGTVSLVVNGVSTPLTVTSWNDNEILAVAPTVNGNNVLTGQLVVTNDNGSSTTNAVTVTVSSETPIRVPVDQPTIQAAIDNASNGALILVGPGTYNEQVIMWKPVRLQGAGTSTIIDALVSGTTALQAWRDKLATYLPNVDLLPGQTTIDEEGAGVTVIGKAGGPPNGRFGGNNPSRIDGFTIKNASSGGAIMVVANASELEVSNNNIDGNSGTLHGGIRIGQPFLPGLVAGVNYNFNSDVKIHNNAITSNGALFFESAGGGVSINTGSLRYTVANNFICGNFTAGDGAGIGHLGVSNMGVIKSNTIVFNQSLNNSFTQSGGGISVGGEPGNGGALTLGSGNVVIDSNLIQGNTAASGHGGGIRTTLVNGSEATATHPLWKITMTNNMVVNNVAAYSGGGIALQDTVNATIVNNTVSNNDSTATVGGLIVNNTSSAAQPAGIVAELNSMGLANAVSALKLLDPTTTSIDYSVYNTVYSEPQQLLNNIIWHNRAFHFGTLTSGATGLLPELAQAFVGDCGAGAQYWDLGVLGSTTLSMAPQSSILTSTTGYDASNLSGDPDFLNDYCNGARTLSTPGPILATPAIGEGGNFIDVRYGPLTLAWPAASAPWDYHIGANSAGLNNAVSNGSNVPDLDIDGDPRPKGNGPNGAVDRGADERVQ